MQQQQRKSVAQQIQKQLNRIKRIATSLAKIHPSIATELDELILSSLKIEKLLNEKTHTMQIKYLGYRHGEVENQYMGEPQFQEDDQYYNDAMLRIEKCMEKFGRFQRKINVMIHEAQIGDKAAKSRSIKILEKDQHNDCNFRGQSGKQLSEKFLENGDTKIEQNKREDAQNRYKNSRKQQNLQQNTVNKENSLKSSAQRLRILSKKDDEDAQQLNKLKKLDSEIKQIIKRINKQKNWSFSHIEENENREINGYDGEDQFDSGDKVVNNCDGG